MTFDAMFVLVVMGIAIVLITFEIIAIHLVAVALIVVVGVGGVLTAEQAFSGFANDVVIALVCVFVIAGTIAKAKGRKRSGRSQSLWQHSLTWTQGRSLFSSPLPRPCHSSRRWSLR